MVVSWALPPSRSSSSARLASGSTAGSASTRRSWISADRIPEMTSSSSATRGSVPSWPARSSVGRASETTVRPMSATGTAPLVAAHGGGTLPRRGAGRRQLLHEPPDDALLQLGVEGLADDPLGEPHRQLADVAPDLADGALALGGDLRVRLRDLAGGVGLRLGDDVLAGLL